MPTIIFAAIGKAIGAYAAWMFSGSMFALVAGAAGILVAGAAVVKGAMSLFEIDMPKMDGDQARQRTVRSTTEPQKIIYGEALVSGPIAWIGVADGPDNNNEDLYHAIALAGHEVNAITDIHFDNEVITNSQIASGLHNNSNTYGRVTAGTFGPASGSVPICWINKHLGTSTQTADPMLTNSFSEWTSAHQGRGIAYIVTKWRLDDDSQEVWDKYAPNNIKALVQGKKVYDPRLDTSPGANPTSSSYITYDAGSGTYTKQGQNPALCLVDYLMDSDYGLGIPASKIDWSYVVTAANACDTQVLVPPASPATYERRFTCNGVIFATDSHKRSINKILSSMNGSLIYVNGKYIIRAGTWEAAAHTLDEDDLAGPVAVRTSFERSDRFNTISGGVFVDPSQNHKSTEFPKVQNSTALQRDNNVELSKQIELPMTNSSYMAQRIAYKLLLQTSQQKIVTFPAKLSAMRISVGERVQVSLEEFGWSNKNFKCMGWTFSEDGGINLTLREDDSSVYNDPAVSPTNEYSTVTADGDITAGFRGVPAPSGLTATAGVKSIELDWTNPGNPKDFELIHVYSATANDNTDSSFQKIGEVRGTKFTHDGSNAVDAVSVGDTRYYWIRSVKYAGTSNQARSSLFPTSQTTTASATVGKLEWVNVSDPTIGISLDAATDGIEIVYNAETTTTGQDVTQSGLIQEVTIDGGGITMAGGGSIKGGQTGYDTGTGFFLGYDSAYKFSIGNSGGNKLTFDGQDLTVTGAITATSGSIANSVTIGGTAASTVESGAAAGATALQIGDISEIISEGNIPTGKLTFNTSGGATITFSGNNLTSSGGTDNSWESQAYSSEHYDSPVVLQFEVGTTGLRYMMGLNEDPTTNASYATIDYAWYQNVNTFTIYESGTNTPPDGGNFNYAVGDKLSIVYDGTNIYYYHNSTLKRTVSNVGAKDFYLDSSFYDSNTQTINDIRFAPISRIDYGSIGGVTIEPERLYQGAGVFEGSTTGFYLDSSGKFSLTDKLSFDGTDLTVTGAVNATSGTFTGSIAAGSGTSVTIVGDASYPIYSGDVYEGNLASNDPDPLAASFRVSSDGTVFAKKIDIRDSDGNPLLSSADGIGAALLSQISLSSGAGVASVSGTTSGDAGSFAITTTSSSVALVITAKVAIKDNSIGTLALSGQDSTEALAIERLVGGSNYNGAKIQISFEVDGSVTDTHDIEFVDYNSNQSPSSTQIAVDANYVGGSYNKYLTSLMDAGGALEYIANTGYTGAYGATAYAVVTSKTLTSVSAGSHTIKIKFALLDKVSPYSAITSTTNTGTGIYYTGQTSGTLGNGQARRLYELPDTNPIRFLETAANTFSEAGSSVLTSGGTVSGDLSVTGSLSVTGDFNLTGDINQYNVTNLDVVDKTITVSKGGTQALSDGAGLIVDRGTAADASILWDETNDEFDFSHSGYFSGNLTATQITGLITANVGIRTTYGKFAQFATDSQIDLVSSSDGTWGSAINLVEGNNTSNTDVWSIARKTTGGAGDSSLNFNFGTSNQHDNTNRVAFSSTGVITWSGGGSANANTAYTYSQVGHLPLSGGTMTGQITSSEQIKTTSRVQAQYFGGVDGQELILTAGESEAQLTGITGGNPFSAEYIYAVAETGLQIISSPNNWINGTDSYNNVTWAQRNVAIINDNNGASSLPGTLTLDKFTNTTGTTGTTFLSFYNRVGTSPTSGDISQQQTFIDFIFTDANANEYPQVRIGAQVGPDSDANSTTLEGKGAFVVYTNDSTTDGSSSTAATGLNERFRVSYDGDTTIQGDLSADAATFAGTISSGGITTSGHIQQNYNYELRGKDSNGAARTLLRTNDNKLQIGWSYAGDVEFIGGGSYTKRMAISGSTGDVSIVNDLSVSGTISSGAISITDTSNPGPTSGSLIIEGRRDGAANVLTLRAKDASAPTAALPVDQGPVMRFQGFDGTDFENMAYIFAESDATIADGDAPSALKFATSADGSSSPTLALTLNSSQDAIFAGTITSGAIASSASITASGNSNNFGNTTIAALSATSGTFSASITASGNSNSFGNSSFGTISSGAITSSDKVQSTKAQHASDTSTNAHFRVLPSATTDTTGLTSLFLGTSTLDGYGISLNGARKGTDGTPTFTLRTHYNSTSGSEVLSITNAGKATFGGAVDAAGGLELSNTNITEVNALYFADPGPGEGISWSGGNWAIYESPDDLTTNTAGNLQFVSGGSRKVTFNTSGDGYFAGTVTTNNEIIVDVPATTGAGTGADTFALLLKNTSVNYTANGLTAYNAHTSWDMPDSTSFMASSRPTSSSLWTYMAEVNGPVQINRYAQLDENATHGSGMVQNVFYQYDGAGTAATDMKVPVGELETWSTYDGTNGNVEHVSITAAGFVHSKGYGIAGSTVIDGSRNLHANGDANLADGAVPNVSGGTAYFPTKMVSPKIVFLNDANGDDNYIVTNDNNNTYTVNGNTSGVWVEFYGDKTLSHAGLVFDYWKGKGMELSGDLSADAATFSGDISISSTDIEFTGLGGYITTTGAYALRLQTNNTEALRLTSNQDAVFAGTITSGDITVTRSTTHTTGTISHTMAALDLYNSLEADTDEKGSILTFTDNYFDGTNYIKTTRSAIKGGTDTTGNTANGFLAFYTDSSSANSAEERMRINYQGRVSIGSTSSLEPLYVNGNIRADGAFKVGGSTVIDSSTNFSGGTITATGEIDVNLSAAGKYFEGGSGNTRRLSITSGTNVSAHAKHTFDIASTNGMYVFQANSADILTLESGAATLEGDLVVDSSRILITGDGNYVAAGSSGGGKSAVMGNTQTRASGVNDYRAYFSYDTYWDQANHLWKARRTTLGRKWLQEMGYHKNEYRLRFYDGGGSGSIADGWADADWTDLLKITYQGNATFAGTINTTSDINLSSTATTSPAITFNHTSATDPNIEMAIRATAEGLDFYEPEDSDKVHMRILDDGGVNAVFGLHTGSGDGTERINPSGDLVNIGYLEADDYLQLAKGTTYRQSTDYLYVGGSNLDGADAAIYLGNHGGGSGYGWRFYYHGSGSGNLNDLSIQSENLGSPVNVLRFNQDGAATFVNRVTTSNAAKVNSLYIGMADAFSDRNGTGDNLYIRHPVKTAGGWWGARVSMLCPLSSHTATFYPFQYMTDENSDGTEDTVRFQVDKEGSVACYQIDATAGLVMNGVACIDASRNANFADIDVSGDIVMSGASNFLVIENSSETNAGIVFNDYQAGVWPAASSQRFMMQYNSGGESGLGSMIMGHDDDSYNGFYFKKGGELECKGNVTAYGSTSDIRLKENIEVIPNAMSKIRNLDGITFNYKKDGSKSTGLIAQQLLEVLPEVVYETHDHDTKESHYAVRYGNVAGLLVEALKEQDREIKELKLMVKTLMEKQNGND